MYNTRIQWFYTRHKIFYARSGEGGERLAICGQNLGNMWEPLDIRKF